MRTTPRFLASALAIAALAVGAWWALDGGTDRAAGSAPVLRPDDALLTATGAVVYREHCAACHGAALEGQRNWRQRGPDGLLPAPPHDASGHTWHHSDELLVRITRDGVAAVAGDPSYRSAMPAYRGVLSDEEIIAALSWIKSQWPAAVRAKHDQLNASVR
jgi:mono/diheme cytochrome c family protein